jgi:hypothetical protein
MDYQKIFKDLENKRCTAHHLKPFTVPKGENIAIVCCCENFKRELVEKIEKETERQARVDLIENYLFLN